MRRSFRGLLALLVLFTLVAWSDGHPEEKANALLQQARTCYSRNDLDLAEEFLRSLLQQYPSTEAAELAEPWLHLVLAKRQEDRKTELLNVLRSVKEIMEGYRAFQGGYPSRILDLDQNGYTFDSGYLVEIIPAGVHLYLDFAPRGLSYQAWAIREEDKQGFLLDGTLEGYHEFSAPHLVQELRQRRGHRIGNLICLAGNPGPWPAR